MYKPIRHRLHRGRGISLIEVLVVLVLLLIGIFSVVRLFPGGFLVNKQTEEATYAGRLARQQLDFYTQLSLNLMDAIVPVTPVPGGSGYAFQIDSGSLPDDLGPGQPNALGVDPYYYSDLNKTRRVLGEHVRIPSPSATSYGQGSVYMLSVGPVYNVPWLGGTESIFVSGAPMTRRVDDVSDPDPGVFSPQQYAIDYDAFSVAFRQSPFARQFLLTYSYYDANNQVQTIVDEVINVAAGFRGWIATTGNGGRPLAPDSDVVARKFRLLNLPDLWSQQQATPYDDPYEFKILSQNEGAFANVGVLLFNPFGYNHTEFTPSGPQPLTARIDYDVLDWHIIREDRTIPSNAPYNVKLSLKGIKRVTKAARGDLPSQEGDYEQDQTEYLGIFRDTSVPAVQRQDVLIYNVATGTVVPEIDATSNTHNYRVSYKEGIVTFNENAVLANRVNASGNYRFFYKVLGDWGMAIQKASHRYRRREVPNVGLSEFYTPVVPADVGDHTRMYFPLMDAGKTVSIREVWFRDVATNVPRKESNVAFRINANPRLFETLNGQAVTWIDLESKFGDGTPNNDDIAWDTTTVGQPAVGVQGVSFRSRVIWTSGGTIDEVAGGQVARTRWRKVDLDSFLTRSSTNQ